MVVCVVKNIMDICDKCDHENFYEAPEEVVTKQLENARIFLGAVEAWLKTL